MAGNKGRGRAAYTFNIEAVGFSRGEKLPDVVLKPPPLFPDTDYKPVPLKTGESEDYVLALKQELRETVKRMPYFVETPEEKQDIERYSKRYMKVYKEEWIPDWRRLPRELMPRKKCRKAGPRSKKATDTGKGPSLTNPADVLKKIELNDTRNWKRKVMVKNQMRKMKRKKEAKRKVKKAMMMRKMMLLNKRNMMKRSRKRKMTTLIPTLKMEMILVQTVTTTWMKQPTSYGISQKIFL
ncbi:DNA-directed RNA polymerase III subunit RPC7 isoform 1-T7 [Dama dama]|uniref:DNA-directed RNA polymerase III subunit RPC7 isoform X1 n=1 Tax=Dama dama TaxID=30532 RepID=UPI002A363BCC|nr:DNA-directed RNA polymerase III subunit RPC7 isoform X1 [Dama dama]XP_061007975.1 DNA-directed RNA polymerase III subunit RPC7 isoform X1 [Dama dama]